MIITAADEDTIFYVLCKYKNNTKLCCQFLSSAIILVPYKMVLLSCSIFPHLNGHNFHKSSSLFLKYTI